MAIRCVEKQGSPIVTNAIYPEAEAQFVVTGTTSEHDALAAVSNACVDYYDLFGDHSVMLPRSEIRVSPTSPSTWIGTVRYAKSNAPIFAFDMSGGTQKLTNSIRTVNAYAGEWQFIPEYSPAPGETPRPNLPTTRFVTTDAPNFKNAIAWDGETVNGCDVIVPVYNWSETWYLPGSMVTGAYKAKLFQLTGRINQNPFRDFQPGEVLFMGARGSRRGTEDWEINFAFAASQNDDNISVGDLAGIHKRGWDYLWVNYRKSEDSEGARLIPVPSSVHVEQVYKEGDFEGLGIGTA